MNLILKDILDSDVYALVGMVHPAAQSSARTRILMACRNAKYAALPAQIMVELKSGSFPGKGGSQQVLIRRYVALVTADLKTPEPTPA